MQTNWTDLPLPVFFTMIKKWRLLLTILISIQAIAWAQPVTHHTLVAPSASIPAEPLDSTQIVRNHFIKDSLKLVSDSLAWVWIKPPDKNRPNIFLDSLVQVYKVHQLNFKEWGKSFLKKTVDPLTGKYRLQREQWIIGIIFLLIVLFALIKNAFSKQLMDIIYLFFFNRSLLKTKEDNLFNSWVFLFLYLLFGFTFGMYFYLVIEQLNIVHTYVGVQWFLILSGLVLGFFAVKIISLQLVGFIFGIQKPVKEHIATLCLFFSNITMLYIPVIIALSLLPQNVAKIGSHISLILLGSIFVLQCFRAFFRILFGYQFSIIYLFIYLCILELCPLIILIKVFTF